MIDIHYTDPALAALYDHDSGWGDDRDFYLALADGGPMRILDLGCGTGMLTRAYAARGHRVTGVDPARAMLDVARRGPHGGAVTWVESRAEDFRTDDRFDLVVMTGNAFMALLTDDAIEGTFAAARRHLADGGRFAFETRNPDVDWAELFSYRMDLDTPAGMVIETRIFRRMEGDLMFFDLVYSFADGRRIVAPSCIRFSGWQRIVTWLSAAGLTPETMLGGWHGEAFDAERSKPIVFLARGSQA